MVLPSRAYDLAVSPRGTYVLALGTGVVEIDACTLDRAHGCDDAAEARALLLDRDGVVATYLRRDGSLAACDLGTDRATAPDPRARRPLLAPPSVEGSGSSVYIDAGAAWFREASGTPQRLPTTDEPLDVARDDEHRLIAISDRAGAITVFSMRDRRVVARWLAHPRNAYAVAFDVPRRRVVSVSGPGKIHVRALPTEAPDLR